MAAGGEPPVRVGVLALQGSFREHMALLAKVPGVTPVEVRTREELAGVAGLVIPGGESTTMALVAQEWGLIQPMQAFAAAGKPVWGTCAGAWRRRCRAPGAWAGGRGSGGGRSHTPSVGRRPLLSSFGPRPPPPRPPPSP